MDNVVELAEIRSRRVLEELRDALLPGGPAPTDPAALAGALADKLERLPQAEARAYRRRMAMAVQDLERLGEALRRELAQIARDLRAVSAHGAAASAYCRTTSRRPRP